MIFMSNCTLCNPGTYSDVLAATLPSTCTQCPKGTYSTGNGMDSVSLCQNCRPGTYQPNTGITTNSSCQTCARDYYCPIASVQEKCPSGTFSEPGGISQLNCRCTAGYYCAYKEMITAVISLNVSKANFDNNTNNIRTNFISAVAAAAGVTASDVVITSVQTRTGGGSRRRRLLEKQDNSIGIHIVANIFGARKLQNLEHHIKKNGLNANGHVWAENHQITSKTFGSSAISNTINNHSRL